MIQYPGFRGRPEMGPVLSICTDGADGATVRAPDDKESHRLEVSRELLKRIFACVDLDHSGLISREELCRFARMMGKTEEDIQEMFGAMDTDHSNSISEAEWLSFWLDWRYLQLSASAYRVTGSLLVLQANIGASTPTYVAGHIRTQEQTH
jgi:hypothetical protein